MLLALCASPAAQQLPGPLHCIGVAKALTVLGRVHGHVDCRTVCSPALRSLVASGAPGCPVQGTDEADAVAAAVATTVATTAVTTVAAGGSGGKGTTLPIGDFLGAPSVAEWLGGAHERRLFLLPNPFECLAATLSRKYLN